MGINTKQKHVSRFIKNHFEGNDYLSCLSAVETNIEFILDSSTEVYCHQAASIVKKSVSSFLNKFFTYINSTDQSKLKKFTDACKLRQKDLKILREQLSLKDNVAEIFVVPMGTDKVIQASNLEYFSKSSIYLQNVDEEFDNVFTNEVKPRLFAPLFVGVLKLFQLYYDAGVIDGSSDYLAFVNIIITCSNIYTELNLPDREVEGKARDTLTLLTAPTLVLDDDFLDLFNEVKEDIKDNTLPYVSELNRAINRSKDFVASPFSAKDFYFSLKASASKSKRFKRKKSISILSSCWETDSYIGHRFDKAVEYYSTYNINENGEDTIWGIITMMIDNPGKVDPRAIHIATNAIQDRCMYIHRRMARLLSYLPSDCSKDQQKGIEFIKRITSDKFRDKNNYPSGFNADFTNATDTLSQEFQIMCLSLVFKEEVVEFWKDISQSSKYFKIGKNFEQYIQYEGQPQGLLGSFDAFAFAHHLLFLMAIKREGLEMFKGSELYVVLGDDSAATSMVPNKNLMDSYEFVVEKANLIFNRSKAGYFEPGYGVISRLDFAKVTVCNGKYDTPIPSRIFFRCDNTKSGLYYKISVLSWLNLHGRNTEDIIEKLILTTYDGNEQDQFLAIQLLQGGVMPVFKGFKKNSISEDLDPKLLVAYMIHKVKSTFVEAVLGDKAKETLAIANKEIGDPILSLLPTKIEIAEQYLDVIENSNHKFLIALQNNEDISEALSLITGENDVEWALMASALYLEDSEIKTLTDLSVIINDIMEYDIYPDNNQRLFELVKELNSLERFEMRSLVKRTANNASYFDEIISLYKLLDETNE